MPVAFGLAVLPPLAGLQSLSAWAWIVSVAAALPLVVRRRWPVAAFAVSAAVSVAGIAVGAGAFLAAALALYTVASTRDAPRGPSTGLVGGFSAAGAVALAAVGAPAGTFASAVPRGLLGLVLLGGAWTAGRAVHERRRSAEREIERARMDERLRIAREMHDVVTHGMGLIAVQAGVANHVVGEHPEEARRALAVIEDVSRRSLGEMRAMLGVLRGEADEAALEPAPDLSDLPKLVQDAGAELEFDTSGPQNEAQPAPDGAPSGMRFDADGTPSGGRLGTDGAADGVRLGVDGVPSGVQVAAFRIVQEALTNVRRHAGAAARCRVRVHSRPGRLDVEIRDTGTGVSGVRAAGGGFGLVGMRERALAHGGEFEAGPVDGGGFAVRATLRY
ncbi:sensor histidine kinase [Actinomadura rupiterrae]|uniref:sensor histidine kinase n=1 Tax=Actinomadura rupiterrae TaxID=559627 RepID=UPI0020A2BE95|nr:histidine kinase [Actinomadura rupiterrae]MCP2337069.1 signal transduction histidine kinase [Actinomadura rupiterrae]